MAITAVESGYQRDSRIVATVADWGALTTEQIRCLLFPFRYGLRKAQQRLQRLEGQGRLRRSRHQAGYVYYPGKPPGHLDHLVATNWARLWLMRRRYYVPVRWEYEATYGQLRTDGVMLLRNTFTGKHDAWFVELDRSHNAWTKAEQYCQLYASGRYGGAWWVPYLERWPGVLCVTEDAARVAPIKAAAQAQNSEDLRFDVRLLADLTGEVRG